MENNFFDRAYGASRLINEVSGPVSPGFSVFAPSAGHQYPKISFGIKTRSAFANKWRDQFLLTTMIRVKQPNAVAVSRQYQLTGDSRAS